MQTQSITTMAELLSIPHEKWIGERSYDTRPYWVSPNGLQYLPVPYEVIAPGKEPEFHPGSDLTAILQDFPEDSTIYLPVFDGSTLEGHTLCRRHGSHYEAIYEGEFL